MKSGQAVFNVPPRNTIYWHELPDNFIIQSEVPYHQGHLIQFLQPHWLAIVHISKQCAEQFRVKIHRRPSIWTREHHRIRSAYIRVSLFSSITPSSKTKRRWPLAVHLLLISGTEMTFSQPRTQCVYFWGINEKLYLNENFNMWLKASL